MGGIALGAVGAGYAALDRGDWTGAAEAFAAVLADEQSADALDGLGQALWWASDVA